MKAITTCREYYTYQKQLNRANIDAIITVSNVLEAVI